MRHYRTESITNLGAKIWELVPHNVKEVNSLFRFKSTIKKWRPKSFACVVKYFAKVCNAWSMGHANLIKHAVFCCTFA